MKTPEIEFLTDIMQSITRGRNVSDKDIKTKKGVTVKTKGKN
jgi:hypothetical protein